MTLITDDTGTRWVELPTKKRRKKARAVRFAAIKPGDQVMRPWKGYGGRIDVWYYVVTDLWFDPVAGQDDDTAGRMVAIQSIDSTTGQPRHHKVAHTLRGLASQGFQYADIDFMSHAQAVKAAKDEGAVVGIGFGYTIRQRPKLPGPRSL